MGIIIDTPDTVTSKLSALKATGVTTVIRYLNPLGQTSKVVTPAEAKAIAASGLRMGLVSEGYGDFRHGSINASAGARDAKAAFSYAPLVGASRGNATIYFAVDTDSSDSQVENDVIPYFRAISDYNDLHEQGEWQVGIYAGGAACKAAAAGGFVSKTWLANATGWNGSKDYLNSNAWVMRQHLPTTLSGVDVDVNTANPEKQIGDFVPFGLPAIPDAIPPVIVPPAVTVPPVAPVLTTLSASQLQAIVQATLISFGDNYITNQMTGVESLFQAQAKLALEFLVPGAAQAVVAALLKKGKFVHV